MMTRLPSKSAGTVWAGALLLLLVACIGGGCLSKPALRTQMFAFQTPQAPPAPPPVGNIVMLRSVSVSPVFDNNSFIYRTGPETYEVDRYASFMATPGQAIAIAVRARLLATGNFRNVIEPGSLAQADQLMEINVSEFYGDFSKPGKSAAVLSMRISLFHTNDAGNRRPILEKDYSCRIALKDNTAADVMAGWNVALNQIVNEFVADEVRSTQH